MEMTTFWHLNVKEKKKSQYGEWRGASLFYAYYAEIGRFRRAMSRVWQLCQKEDDATYLDLGPK